MTKNIEVSMTLNKMNFLIFTFNQNTTPKTKLRISEYT